MLRSVNIESKGLDGSFVWHITWYDKCSPRCPLNQRCMGSRVSSLDVHPLNEFLYSYKGSNLVPEILKFVTFLSKRGEE